MAYRQKRGLGYTYEELWASMGGHENCSPMDSACVARMAARADAVLNTWATDPASGHNSTANLPIGSPAPPTAVTVALPPVTAMAIRGGSLSFSTSSGGSAAKVGDSWTVTITGASPNMQVSVSGSGPGGAFAATAMGSTDGAGNFSKSGTFDSSAVGNWQESWYVGSAASGSISFTVAPAVAVTAAGKVIITSSGAAKVPAETPAAGSGTPASTTVAGFDLSTIPVWGWAVAAGVALFAFGGQRGR